ncbi:MAG: acetate kinase [SAR324 cluster bacterium]|nr:acetate kinase [SAR324 cluster bacterium]
MKILVLNAGSSSLKYQVFEDETMLAHGMVEQIGEPLGDLIYEYPAKNINLKIQEVISDHKEGLEQVLALLLDPEKGLLSEPSEIKAVGHRVVHGGTQFSTPVIIDSKALQAIKDCVPLAPLHNPANILGIETATQVFNQAKQVAVFDTAFHQTLPEHSYLYALDPSYFKDYGVRRYGFHGTSHKYVALRAAEQLLKPLEQCNLITLHLGNGASACAIKNGVSVDTSMGLTPLEGLIMGTRSGDLDPAILGFLVEHTGKSLDQVEKVLNKASGLKGLTGKVDFREICEDAIAGNEAAKLALDMTAYRIKKYIGAYLAITGPLDAIIFTAGIGEHSSQLRAEVCKGLEHLGLELDLTKNQNSSGPEISSDGSKIKILVVPTNEELQIAREALALVK